MMEKHQIKVCTNVNCCRNGSEKVYEAIAAANEVDCEVVKTGDCFRFCKQGPNVAVDGHVLRKTAMLFVASAMKSILLFPSKKMPSAHALSTNSTISSPRSISTVVPLSDPPAGGVR